MWPLSDVSVCVQQCSMSIQSYSSRSFQKIHDDQVKDEEEERVQSILLLPAGSCEDSDAAPTSSDAAGLSNSLSANTGHKPNRGWYDNCTEKALP
jgi:hypothetical protein